jgi:hypothetical protein
MWLHGVYIVDVAAMEADLPPLGLSAPVGAYAQWSHEEREVRTCYLFK